MRLTCVSVCVLAASLTANYAYAELPTKDDPLPFADVALPTAERDTPNDQPSTSTPPIRPYGPFATVDNLGDPERIEFRGLSQVPVEDIRSALRWDPKFQAAARPSNSAADFLAVLESCVLDGFQSSGFPEAKVAISLDTATKRFVVAVTEGPRFRQGKIVVTGDDRVDAKQLADWLTHEQKPRPWTIRYANSVPSAPSKKGVTLWTPGENLNFTQRIRDTLEAGVRFALVEQGFPHASFELEYVPAAESGCSDLHVKLRHVGAPSTIKEINVQGLHRDSREQLLEYLQIAPGQPFNAALLDRIHAKLADSCRYWSHHVEVHCGPKPDGRYVPADESVTLDLALEEFSPVPPLHEPLSEIDEVLRKAAAWINSYPREGSPDLVIEKINGQQIAAGETLAILPSAVSADGQLAINLRGASNNWSFDHSLYSNRKGLAVVDWHAKQKFASSFSTCVKLDLRIAASRREDGDYAQGLFAAWNVSSDDESEGMSSVIWTVHAEPVAVVYSAHRSDSKAEINDGILKIKSRDTDFEFDANTGALIRLAARNTDGFGELTARMIPGGYETVAQPLHERARLISNRYDRQRPMSSLIAFALEQLQHQPFIIKHDAISRTLRVARLMQEFPTVKHLLSRLDQKWLELQANSAKSRSSRRFFLTQTWPVDPSYIASIIEIHPVYYLPGFADRLFPRGSWPWTLTREGAFARLANGSVAEPTENWNRMVGELVRLERADDLSPIAAWLCVDQLRYNPGHRGLALLFDRVANCGLRQSTDQQLVQDIDLLASGDGGWAKLVCKLVDDFVSLPAEDQRDFLDLLPKPWAEALSELQQRRTEKPDETTGDALAHVLHNRWQDIAGKAIEARLREHTTTTFDIPSTATKPVPTSQK